MDVGLILLRIVHIGSAILWAGGSVFIERFVQPTANALGPAGEQFMTGMVRRRMAVYFPIVAGLTVLAGSVLYWHDASGDVIGYLTGGGPGTVFGIGGIAAWIGFIVGAIGIGPNANKLARAGAEMARTGPTPDLEAEANTARAAIHRAGQIGLVMLAIAIVTMASARYV
jgi:uncharacterized membrane protein